MRSQKAMNAACWDCRFYSTLKGIPVCRITSPNIPMTMMPMKCNGFEKAK